MSDILRKGTLLGESCHRMENGKRVTYRATSALLKGLNTAVQSNHFMELPLVSDLSSESPVDENGYVGWGLHYMYFLQSKGYIGELCFERAVFDLRPSDYMERRMELYINNWVSEKKNEFNGKFSEQKMKIYADNTYYSMMLFDDEIRVFTAIKDFDYNNTYFGFVCDPDADKESEGIETGYMNWLIKNDYISSYEMISIDDFVPLAF